MRRWSKVRSKVNGAKSNLVCNVQLLHFVEDRGSGVSVDQFAVVTCKLQTFH